jgi:dethiobiotin synthetase
VRPRLDNVRISPEALTPPALDPLVIEGAGGALVPVTRDLLYADLFARWKLPVVIVARTGLGTINHSLMTIEALRHRRVEITGIAFVGDAVEDSEATIATIGRVKRLGRLPLAGSLDPAWLQSAFAEAFDLGDFA